MVRNPVQGFTPRFLQRRLYERRYLDGQVEARPARLHLGSFGFVFGFSKTINR